MANLNELPRTVRPRVTPREVLLQARTVIAAGDREAALRLLVAIAAQGERTAVELPEAVAHALVATARKERNHEDEAALRAYREMHSVRDDIVALLQDGILDPDDLAAIRQALDAREAQERAKRTAEAEELVQAARETTEAALQGPEGRMLAVKLGRAYLEVKYIPRKDSGRLHGPYLYARWRDGRVLRSRYIGKPASG